MRPVMNRSESFIEKYEDPAGDGNPKLLFSINHFAD